MEGERSTHLEKIKTEIKKDWELFWAGIKGAFVKRPLDFEEPAVGSIEELSFRRKTINQRIDQLRKKIDFLSKRVEVQRLFGTSTLDYERKLVHLTEEGQFWCEKLTQVTLQLQQLRKTAK